MLPNNIPQSFHLPSFLITFIPLTPQIPNIFPHFSLLLWLLVQQKKQKQSKNIHKFPPLHLIISQHLYSYTRLFLLCLYTNGSQLGGGANWAVARSAAKYPTMHKTAPHNRIIQAKMSLLARLSTPAINKPSMLLSKYLSSRRHLLAFRGIS